MADAKKSELAEADYVAGMKYKDIAAKYDVSINTVKSWRKRYAWSRKGAPKNKKGCTQNEIPTEKVNQAVKEEVEEIIENSELSDKQRLFCVLYTRCFNATKAYQKAYGVNYTTAASSAYRMLENVGVKNEINRLKQNRFNKEMLSEEDIVQMYIDILYADIGDYLDTKHNMIDLNGPYADGRLIKKVSFGKTESIELLDKMVALKWLSEHMNLATEKQKAEVKLLKAKINGETDEEKAKKRQAQDNMAEILKQLHPINEDDVYE